MLKAIVACATFKGTLSSKAAGEAVARGLRRAGLEARAVALADGGEGLVEALSAQVTGVELINTPCRGPLQAPCKATFAILPGIDRNPAAVLEMAASSGLPLVSQAQRDPKITTTLGVGDQILAALKILEEKKSSPSPPRFKASAGKDKIFLGLGGSATNDGGAGMAQALGAKLLDRYGKSLRPGGAALRELDRIDISRLEPRLKEITAVVACDVRNPLCGPQGASFIFGPQKGGTPEDLKLLDEALAHYAAIIKRDLGCDVADVPGAGAAGGLGAGCLAFLNASLRPGIELVLDAINFDTLLSGCDLVITGEGRLDEQTLMGKAPAGVAARARQEGMPCLAIGGSIDHKAEAQLKSVFQRTESLSAFAGSTENAMREPARWLEELAFKMMSKNHE